MRTLADPNAAWADDDGRADPRVRSALASFVDHDSYLAALVALGGARLLLAIHASGDDSGTGPNPQRHAELAVGLVEAPSGARALPAFTGVDSLQRWNAAARPVPKTLDQVAAAAVECGASSVVVDIAGPAVLEISAEVMTQFAGGRRLVRLGDGGFGWAVVGPA